MNKYTTKMGNECKNEDVQLLEKGYSKLSVAHMKNSAGSSQNTNIEKPNGWGSKSPDKRQKPQIQLPLNPQIPSDTQRLNPRYNYKTLVSVKNSSIKGDLDRVNMFAVVHQISKSLTTTSTGKYTIICKIVDESSEWMNFDLHFFIPDSSIIKLIEVGDVLRLHRVKMESWHNDIDGRVFRNQDIMLFKSNASEAMPISSTKNSLVTEDEKQRVQNLKKWYKEAMQQEMNRVVLLSNICEEGEYQVLVQLVLDPKITLDRGLRYVALQVTDGSLVHKLQPALPLEDKILGTCPAHIVTEIMVFERTNDYAKLKAGDFVMLREVKAARSDALRLMINSQVTYQVLNPRLNKVLDIRRRINQLEEDAESLNLKHLKLSKVGAADNDARATRQGSTNTTNKYKDETIHTRSETLKESPTGEEITSLRDSSHNNKSGLKQRKHRRENKELDNNVDNAGGKTRKTLFTANYTDLSDATDDGSDILDSLTQLGGESSKGVGTVIVTPANTSFGDLIELVKTKYCSPRKLSSSELPKNSERLTRQNASIVNDANKNISEELQTTKSNGQNPIVKLVKLTEEDCRNSTESRQKAPVGSIGGKRYRDTTESVQENLENASTVVNMSYQNNIQKNAPRSNKRQRLESESTVLGERCPAVESVASVVVDVPSVEVPQQKVSSWLLDPNNQLREEAESKEMDLTSAKQVLLGLDMNGSPDKSTCLTSPIKRLKLFLLAVTPEPTSEPLDLVSGYCRSGCQQLFLFTRIRWHPTEDVNIPLCPNCYKLQREQELQLMFVFELHVMDTVGKHGVVLVCREHAEMFLNCTTRDFVVDPAIRASRSRLLSDYTVEKTLSRTPLLDISVVLVGHANCLINSKLKLPSDNP